MDDPYLHPLDAREWPPELEHVLKDLRGRPMKIHGLSANSPGLMNACWHLRNYLIKENTLGQRKNELAVLRVTAHKSCWYQWGDHVDRALRLGIEIEEILGLLEPVTERIWSEEERALIMAVDDLMTEDHIRPVTLAILNKNYSNQQVIDLIAATGFVSMMSCMLQSWKVSLEEDIEMRITPVIDQVGFRKRAEENF